MKYLGSFFRGSMKSGFIFQYLAASAGTLNIINSGMLYGWPSPSLPKLLDSSSHIPTTNEEGLWISVMVSIGAVFGSMIAAILLDRIGRKNTILLSSLPLFISWIMVAFAKSVPVLIAARFVAGISEGFIWSGIPVYLGEIADPKIRGFLGSVTSVTWILGMLLINVIGSYLSISTTALVASSLPVLLLLTFSWMPESPYYLLMQKNVDKARRSLRVFKGLHDVEEELNRIAEAIEKQNKDTGKVFDLFRIKSNRRALFVIMVTRTAQQFSGNTAIMFYAQIIFKQSGDSISPTTGSIAYFGLELLVSGFSSLLVDKSGRKPLLIISIIGSGFALLVEACYLYVQNSTDIDTTTFSYVSIIALILYILFFSIGLQAIPVLLLGEMFPTNIKAFAVSLADVYLAVVVTLVSKFFQATNDKFGMHVPFFAFTICCVLGLLFIIYFVPETKGKTLEEIQEELKGECRKITR